MLTRPRPVDWRSGVVLSEQLFRNGAMNSNDIKLIVELNRSGFSGDSVL